VADRSLDAALQRIWERAQPRLLARVDAIDDAIAALDDSESLATGRAEAHKIAGLAGTFGLGEASRLARSIEHQLEAGEGADRDRLRREAVQLRAHLTAP
jgi:HPt (histidine-containing phosphotransfer) domain-containing protein